MRAVILGNNGGKHVTLLREALAAHGIDAPCLPITRVTARPGGEVALLPAGIPGQERALEEADTVFVRCVPGGSLEQVIYRVNVLHCLELAGKRVINNPKALERGVDKFFTLSLLAAQGLPVPATIVTERFDEAMAGFEELGGDVVVKPLFGSEGRGMTRVSDPDMAYRVFKALEMGRYIFYIQEFLDHGNEDVRLFVVGGRVIGSMLRRGASWKTNLAAGARGVPFEPDEEMVDMAIRSAEAIEADYAGVDVLMCASGRRVVEVNTIPAWAGLKEATGVDAGEALVSYALGLSG